MLVTKNLLLNKPGYTDPADIMRLNENMDIIDELKEILESMQGKQGASNIGYDGTLSGLLASDLQSAIDELKKLANKPAIVFGSANTKLQQNTVLFVLEDEPTDETIGAAFSNMIISAQAPTSGSNWAKIEEGTLSVSETPDSSADYFAKI